MLRRLGSRACLPMLLGMLSGCASVPETVSQVAPGTQQQIELAEVPFFPQERYQCGPAALATVLDFSGVPSQPDLLVDQVYVPGRRGSFQVEMLAVTRASGRLPYTIDGTLAALVAELDAGRPVLVLQNLGVSWIPRWHYAVVVGVDLDAQHVVLRSGTDERRTTDIDLFLRTWQRSEFWGFVTLPPGSLPAAPDRERYLRAVADLEATGQTQASLAGWDSALRQWPGDRIALFGLANAQLALGNASMAEQTYSALLALQPGNVMATNNLAYAIADQGRTADAQELLENALQGLPPATPDSTMLMNSLDDLRRRK